MIKELLKSPFYMASGIIRDADGRFVLSIETNGTHEQNDVKRNFIFAALNEKWQRDFGGEDE